MASRITTQLMKNGLVLPERVVKRDGATVDFDLARIEKAIEGCWAGLQNVGNIPAAPVRVIVDAAAVAIASRHATARLSGAPYPTVEQIQDLVEVTLLSHHEVDAARSYMAYRDARAAERANGELAAAVPEHVREAFDRDGELFNTPMQQFAYYDKYSRFNWELNRRETWSETVDRTIEHLKWEVRYHFATHPDFGNMDLESSISLLDDEQMRSLWPDIPIADNVWDRLRDGILHMRIMPSMRLLAMAGAAARRNSVALYNCSFLGISDIEAFVEILTISFSGCGVGYSVERANVEQFPRVQRQQKRWGRENFPTYVVSDTSEGWADALSWGLRAWWSGDDVTFDYSKVRPAGAVLKTKGGRACLTGDTVIYRDKKKWGTAQNCQTISDLYQTWTKGIGRSREVTVRCLNEATGEFYRNRIVDIVHNGSAPVYEVVLENGYKIKATDNHRFMGLDGKYSFLADLKVGEVMACNGIEVKTGRCVDCGTAISRRAERCKPCFDVTQLHDDANETTARARQACLEARLDECEVCGIHRSERPKMEVHHIDRNPLNNDRSNLINLCYVCHKDTHTREDNAGIPHRQKYVTYAKIESITYVGVEEVFDLQMKAPDHNFVANGFVSHNSGPEPLRKMLAEIRRIVLARQGSFITTVDAHDIACNVGEAAVQGGVRRTAMIALFDWDDVEMRTCKNGPWGTWPSVRTNANNSAVWPADISDLDVMNQMTEMMFGGAGEPGIFSRASAYNTMPQRRREINEGVQLGTNPCGEIFLRPFEFCNLSQAVARTGDTESDLAEKVELATILGTLQSLSTRFPGLRSAWVENCTEERLLGVDLTAQNDCELLWASNPGGGALRTRLAARAVEVNAEYALALHINASAAITCNKPAGNSTGFIGASGSGIHKTFAPFYIRRMTVGAHTPQFRVLREAGVPMQPYADSGPNPDRWWAEFPVKAPAGSPLLRDTSAIQQCEFWLLNKENWTEHNPSCTVTYRLHEAIGLVKWVAEHKNVIGGLSFLPADDTVYPIMPFEQISEQEYLDRVVAFPEVDWSLLWLYERSDMSEASTTLSCFAGNCEI